MKLSIIPPHSTYDLVITWRFHNLPQSFADHVFKYIAAYVDRFRDDEGELPPMPALAEWDPQRYGWAELNPEIPASIAITKIGDLWDFDVIVPNNEDPHQWVDVLYVLKKVATMQFK
jgi:hypothetical protein